jgi:uncharacterized protein YoxC
VWSFARTLPGLVILFGFAATFSAVVVTIAALQFQDSIIHSALEKPKPTLGSIREGVSALEGYYAANQALSDRQDKLQDAINTENDNWDQITAKLGKLYSNLTDIVRSRQSLLVNPDLMRIPFPLRLAPNYFYTLRADLTEYTTEVRTQAAKINAAAPPSAAGQPQPPSPWSVDMAKLNKTLDETVAQFNRASSEFYGTLDQNTNEMNKINQLKTQLDETRAKFGKLDKVYLNAGTHLDSEGFRNICEELIAYKRLLGAVSYTVIFAPRSSLVLFLAVVMGILGSIIFLARALVIEKQELSYSEILFRASLGGAVALAIYVFAAAGMVALGQTPGATNANSDLSPYLISFIGITAGYLSEHMTRWMGELGRKTFKIDDAKVAQRWAVRLRSEMTKQNIGEAELAGLLQVDAAIVRDWCSVANPIPGEYQQTVAAYLRVHPSYLYTDIQPPAPG